MNSTKPLFSIVISTYDRQAMLEQAVSSVLAQTVDDLECIVVDDASPVQQEAPKDQRVHLIRRPSNGGPAAARNTGLAAARGRYIIFLDDDDMFEPHRLEMALEGLHRTPVAICWSRFHDEARGDGRILNGQVLGRILDSTTPHLGATAVDRNRIVPFDESYAAAEDVEWWIRMAATAPVTTVCSFGHIIRRHDTPRHGTGLRQRIDGSLALLSQHAEFFSTHPAAAAFRWKRIGLMARNAGDRRLARRALARSMRMRPQLTTLTHLARATVR